MSTSVIGSVALVGLPNCGKTSLFNALTGGRQKVANYPGVTVERKEGWIRLRDGQMSLLDLPGTYSLDARTPDEVITREVVLGRCEGEAPPQVLIAVADATNLERTLGLVLELKDLGIPMVLALNMMDLARERGLILDLAKFEARLGFPVVPTVAVKGEGLKKLIEQVRTFPRDATLKRSVSFREPTPEEVRARFARVDAILKDSVTHASRPARLTQSIDRAVLHPFWGLVILLIGLGVMFQAIFSWASFPADWIEIGVGRFGKWVSGLLSEGPLRSLLVDGVIAGVGSVLVFLPQILILFTFIFVLEDSGYLARAAFMMDRSMSLVGLHGRAFIPLLSSYACAIPGVMATRTIANPRDRLATILVAPLTTCSARLPVYTLLVGAFIPERQILGWVGLRGLVLFALYLAGTLAPLGVAWVLRKSVLKGPKPPLLLELPSYKRPSLRGLGLSLLERAKLFVRRAGTVILSLSVAVWFLSSYPKPPSSDSQFAQDPTPAIHYSFAGKIGHALEPVLKPLGFDWRVGVALVPGFAAREVMVGALGTVYSIESAAKSEEDSGALGARLAQSWSLATALSLMVWYVFAPQCLSTVAVVRRETNSWKWAGFLVLYMTTLAYTASLLMYQAARALGWG